ncbi:MAG TPA: protein kinase [Polyangiaceae bacterium]|jgi:tetratricopeptide (TPR) repeat protein
MPQPRTAKRFEVVRRLGQGGMGVVYEALDHDRGERVALKTLSATSAAALVRFKREFRALQDLHHPNVVTLGELISEGDEWFFTMELVEGTDFLSYVRRTHEILRLGDELSGLVTADESHPPQPIDPPSLVRRRVTARVDEERLRAVLRQLVDALGALHDRGLVHRDVKPSNIRVTEGGRLVLLDFGVVGELEGDHEFTAKRTVGTPMYMAPEQIAGDAFGPEADWYAVGVLLYEALTGELPFDGATALVFAQKQMLDPRPPSAVVPDIPADLDALCVSLLQLEPAARPSSRTMTQAYGSHAASERPARPGAIFVGRTQDLEALRAAYDDARSAGAVSVVIEGESGVGKSCLTRHFLETLAADVPDLLVLGGRCYERESVPYKAFDGVVDAIARALGHLPGDEARPLLPREVGPLVQVFPVLRTVEAIDRLPGRRLRALDPHDLRRRAFAALRELMTRLAAWRPLVLAIDDIQWADDDSRKLLSEVLGAPSPAPLLFVATRRTDGGDVASTGPDFEGALPGEVRRLRLSRLSSAEALDLAARLWRESGRREPIDGAAIAREADGHPLFVDVLVRHHELYERAAAGVRLEDALRALVGRLDDLARDVMQLVAMTGEPIAHEVLARAAGVENEQITKCISFLRTERLVATTRAGHGERIDLFHDRIRPAVVALLDPEGKVRAHRRLAAALEATGGDVELLASHCRGAGDLDRAARYTIEAADRAARALAFERAARLYQSALTLNDPSADERRALHGKLAEALANAGRGAPAAKAFLAASEGAAPAERFDRQVRAASQLLRSGHIDEGTEVIQAVLGSIGWRLPATPRVALFLFLFRRFLLFVRGLSFTPREASQVPPEALARIDICWAATHSLGMSDYARSAPFQALHLILALRSGETGRVARALTTEVMTVARAGGKTWPRTQRLMRRSMDLAERAGSPRTVGWAIFACGYGEYLAGRFRPALELLEKSQQVLRECAGSAYEIATVQRTYLMCLAHLGQFKELARLRPIYVREAFDRGDLFGVVNMRLGYSNIASLVEDDPDEARAEIAESLRQWSKDGFHLEHYFALLARANADLYAGDAAAALALTRQQWPALRGSMLLTVQSVRMLAHWGRGRCALAVAEKSGAGAGTLALLAEAAAEAKSVQRERWGWSYPIAALLGAGVERVRAGARGGAESEAEVKRLLASAVAGFEEAEMALHAAAARTCLGKTVGGEEGRALVSAAEAWMRSEGIVSPERMTRMLAPGFES